MRPLALALATSLAAASAAAQPTPAPPVPLTLPRAYAEYSQPDITPGLCKVVNPNLAQCTIPAMTAGRYLVETSGTSTATADGAVQQLTIQINNTSCQTATNKNPWPVNKPRTFKFACVVTVLTDRPLTVGVLYADSKANRDPKGPTITLRRLPWEGVLGAQPVVPQQ